MLQVYRLNTGSCGGCDLEIAAAIDAAADIAWAATPFDANVLMITGPVTPGARRALLALLQELDGRVPVLAVGRCAIDGHPFGRGGLAELASVTARLKLDGCPPSPVQIADMIRRVAAGDEG